MRIVLCVVFALLLSSADRASGSRQNPPDADLLLVSLSGEDKIALIRAGSGERVATFDAAGGPHEIAISSDGRYAYIANPGDRTGGHTRAQGVDPRPQRSQGEPQP